MPLSSFGLRTTLPHLGLKFVLSDSLFIELVKSTIEIRKPFLPHLTAVAVLMYFSKSIRLALTGTVSVNTHALLALSKELTKLPALQQLEGQIPLRWGGSAVEILGARRILKQLDQLNAPWAIVTSGTRPLVEGWLKVLGLARPRHLVTAEDVLSGKPDPACYRLGRQKLGVESSSAPVLVLEDAPAGIRAAKAAGCEVVALSTTHDIEQLRNAGADWIIRDLRSFKILGYDPVNGTVSVQVVDTFE